MNTRTTKLAAVGVLALTLPLSATAEAVPLYRFDQPRAQIARVTTVDLDEFKLADPGETDRDELDEASRALYDAAIEDAGAALGRACDVLSAITDDEVPTWQALTELSEAETGLIAARAHVVYVRENLAGHSAATTALDSAEGQLADLLGVLESL